MKSSSQILTFLALIIPLTWAVPCSQDLVGRTYTECFSNLRTAVYYFTGPCDPSDYVLPSPIYQLPCDIQCNAGYRLPFGQRQCTACNPGQYSLGGGTIFSDWTSLPEGFATDCTGYNCATWVWNGTYISSGNNYNNINIDTNLRLFAKFIRSSGNQISFSFKVDAESCINCDGMIFYIDDQIQTPLIAHQLRWATLQFNVTPGIHDFRWTYHKDYSVSRGQDSAFIRNIELFGTEFAPSSCSSCPPGTYATSAGSPSCTSCNYNQYSASAGSTTCLQCAANQASLTGATECTNLSPCQSRQIVSQKTACNPTTRTQIINYSFMTLANGMVQVCDPTAPTSVQLPSPVTVPCTCPPGSILDINGNCAFCPDGTARGPSDATCQPCPAGTAAMKAIYLADWSTLPAGVTTYCQGNCDVSGWIPRDDHIDTGYGAGLALESFLILPSFTLNNPGLLNFTYSLATCGFSCDLILVIDNDQAEEINNVYLMPGQNRVSTTQLDPGNYTLTWRYIQYDTILGDSTKVSIYQIVITGVEQGGAPQCIPCPPGTETLSAQQSVCTPCDPGFYSPNGGLCIQADPGYFTNQYGSANEIQCGANTISNENFTDCLTNCTFSPPTIGFRNIVYDLNPLYNPDTMNFAGTDLSLHQYFINLCSRVHQNATCFDADGVSIPTFACQQVDGWGFSADLGNVIGFLPMDPPDKGLYVMLTEGTPGCATTYNNVRVPRSTNVTMICDVNAGIGSPRPAFNNTVEYPARSCKYYFIWRSLYACPLCTTEDYQVSISACVDNKKVKTYVRINDCWDPNPQEPEAISCLSCPSVAGTTCNGHGTCNDELGVCNCEAGWASAACNACSVGHFGPTCTNECPGGALLPCNGHGSCFSGLTGNGTCVCSTGFTGTDCSTCDDGFEGNTCAAIPASVTDVIPWWGFVAIFAGIFLILVVVFVLWRQKRQVEYKYTSLLRNQPMEMDNDDNIVGIPANESDHEER